MRTNHYGMYISQLKLWNFRKYGSQDFSIDITKPHASIDFKPKMNVLIGENDSGKTAIIDAIRIVLKTHAYDWYRIEDDDFYLAKAPSFRIEIIIRGLTNSQASHFIEWLGWEDMDGVKIPLLRIVFSAKKTESGIRTSDICAGMDADGSPMSSDAKEYLKTTYLKPLRDANEEMMAKRGSRLSQILLAHTLFQKKEGEDHEFERILSKANSQIENWFDDENSINGEKSHKEQIKNVIDTYLKRFISKDASSKLTISSPSIKSILEKLSLDLQNQQKLGLGTMNRLFMAAELLHLNSDNQSGIKTCLIEELEAHLHPQAQMKVIETLQEQGDVQFIITTHSPNLASKINISDDSSINVILCHGDNIYSLCPGSTKLDKSDYNYLQHFLDVTKSNLFFAKGVILVEGWAEEILIPSIAKTMGKDLTANEVSIVNIGSTAYLHFARIFMPNDGTVMDYPVAVVSDMDVRPNEQFQFDNDAKNTTRQKKEADLECDNYDNIKLFLTKDWTLEWCLFNSTSLGSLFKEAVSIVHSGTAEFKKDEHNQWDDESFRRKLRENLLPNASNPLDKVRVANELSLLIEQEKPTMLPDDSYIQYIVDAISHACNS